MCFPHCQAGSLALVSLGKPPQNFKTTTEPLKILKHTLQLHIWKQYVCHLQAISILQWESCSLISYNELKSYCDIPVSRVNLESVLRKFCILTVNLGTFSIKMDLTMSIPQGFLHSPSMLSHSVVSNSSWLYPTRLLCPWDFPGKNSGVGFHFLLQWIFLTGELNWGLLHCRRILYQLSYQGSPKCVSEGIFPQSTRICWVCVCVCVCVSLGRVCILETQWAKY